MDIHSHQFQWGHSKRYNDFPTHFKKRFDERVQKVSIDAGFTCPNRDGVKGTGGCIYCNNKTFKPSYCSLESSVAEQVEKGILFFSKKYASMKFLAYFQAYSNTYAPLENLKELYSEALRHPKVIGLVIATRPDCLEEEVLDYLGGLAKDYYVMVELGVESCEESTLEYINRGHTYQETIKAFQALAQRGIHSCAHVILGLPNEDRAVVLDQAKKISALPVENIKLHQLQIHKNTLLERLYKEDPARFNVYENAEEYAELVVDYLECLRPSIVVERFISQAPREMLLAPRWGLKNFEFVAKIEKLLEKRNTWQGRFYQQL